jgi:hypothetical protein
MQDTVAFWDRLALGGPCGRKPSMWRGVWLGRRCGIEQSATELRGALALGWKAGWAAVWCRMMAWHVCLSFNQCRKETSIIAVKIAGAKRSDHQQTSI